MVILNALSVYRGYGGKFSRGEEGGAGGAAGSGWGVVSVTEACGHMKGGELIGDSSHNKCARAQGKMPSRRCGRRRASRTPMQRTVAVKTN